MLNGDTGEAKRQRRSLPPRKRETLISFNDADGIAVIHTHNRQWQQYLEEELMLKARAKDKDGGRTYEIAKKRIKPPDAPERLSAEAKKGISAYLQELEPAIETYGDILCGGEQPEMVYGPDIRD